METAPQTPPQPDGGVAKGRRRGGRRLERRAAAARAAELGRQHELGELVTEAEQRHGGEWRTGGCIMMLFAIGPGAAFFAAAVAPSGLGVAVRVYAAAVPALLLAGGIALARAAPPERTARILAFTGGLLLDDQEAAAPQVIPWVLLDGVVHDYQTDEGDPVLTGIRVAGLDGTVIAVGGARTRGLDRLGQQIDTMVVAMRLSAAIEQCTSGVPVTFGHLTVGRNGIAWDGGTRRAAWADIRGLNVGRDEIRLETGSWPAGQVIGLDGLPDALVAILLIQDVAARHSIRQHGRPVERPAPPPDDDHVIAARDGLLTELDVSEILGRPAELVSAIGGGGTFATRLFRGGGVTLSVVRLGPGAFSGINQATGRRLGREVAGIGDRAWLVSQERTLIAVAGPATVKLTLSGLPPGAAPAALIPLARLVIDRLGMPSP